MILKDNGSVIIIALVSILILSVTSATMLKRGLFDLKRAKNLFLIQKVRVTAYSAVELAKADLQNRTDKGQWENLSNLLNGSEDELLSATEDKKTVKYKNLSLNGYSIKLYIVNNAKEIEEGLYSEDKDKTIEVRGDIFEGQKNLYQIISVFKMDESKGIKASSTYRSFQ